jgi:uncharacterized membrane protein YdjX (TVP38/TMEM64 family)
LKSHEPAGRWARHGHLVHRVAAIALVTAVLAVVASSDALHGALVELFAAAHRLVEGHPVAGPVAFVLFSAASAMLAFLSSAALVPVAVVAWGPLATAGLLWLGWIVGGVVSYTLARRLGRPVTALLGAGEALANWSERISHRTPFGLVLLFQLAVPSEVPGYVLGFLAYPFRRYLAALALGELPFALGAVLLGESFLERRTVPLVAIGLLGAAASFAAFRALHLRLAGVQDAPPRAGRDRSAGR